jgi:hypothetical protein
MKRTYKAILIGVMLSLLISIRIATAQGPAPRGERSPRALAGTAFTYQGQIKKSGGLLTSTCNFQFSLWDALSGGTQVGTTQTASSLAVGNGLFTTPIDFGNNAFTGDARWLAIAVQCTGDGGYTALNPRQPLNPAPMAFALPGLYTQQNSTSPNVISGYSGNVVTPTIVGATIGGGGNSTFPNRVLNSYTTVGGGYGNIASNNSATVGGGVNNTASGSNATIGGGQSNTASNNNATIGGGVGNRASGDSAITGGGFFNTASGYIATVGGGSSNIASGSSATVSGGVANSASNAFVSIGGGDSNGSSGGYATIAGGGWNTANGDFSAVPGGQYNNASGWNSFAAGRRAKANHQGAFVWGDSTDADVASTGTDQFIVRAIGGVGVNTSSPIANTLTVNGIVVAGGTTSPVGIEPFVSEGTNSGISLDDRTSGGGSARWVIYPDTGSLRFWKSGDQVTINSSGKLTANGGFNGQCLSASTFDATTSSSCNMDFAESFAAIERTEPGDLVTLVTSSNAMPTVRKSPHAYDGLLIGVVSTNPGLIFDNGVTHLAGDNSQLITNDKTVVALVGRVPVKVSMENGAIAIGDPLTSSSRPGFAMKATQVGKIIGYALENANQDGKVLALIQPGYYLPTDQVALAQTNAQLEARVAALERANPSARSNDFNWLFAFALGIVGVVVFERVHKGGTQ